GTRTGCLGAGPPCAGACNGLDRSACVYPGPTVPCGGTCAAATAIATRSTCDGKGGGETGASTVCPGDLTCENEKQCRTACTTDEHCIAGFVCNLATGQCTAKAGARCRDGHVSVSADRSESDCLPFMCDDKTGACKTSCTTVADCVAPNVCSADGH